MKFATLLIIVSIFSFPEASAQYHRMPDSVSTTWRHVQVAFGTIRDTVDYINFSDTVINGKRYQKLYMNAIQDSNYVGGYRDDGAGKVYFLGLPSSLASSEVLLYDFTMEIGDTAEFFPLGLPLSPTSMTVLNTGCLWVNNSITNRLEKRKYQTMSWINNKGSGEWGLYSWIEGIGSMKGLLWRGTPSGWDFHHGILNVYQNGDSLLGRDTSAICEPDTLLSGLLSNAYDNMYWAIYPVPNKGSFNIEFQKEESGVISVQNLHGVEIYRRSFNKTNMQEIDLRQQTVKGIYLVRVINDGGIRTKKVLIE